jgi:adenylylsulfate kinase
MKYTIWLTGLPCSGKTTISHILKKEISLFEQKVIHLDGDIVRCGLCADLGFTQDDRVENIRRIAHLCELLNKEDIVIIASFISPDSKMRDYLKKTITNLKTVFVDCPLEECIERDVKGMYAKAMKGEIPDFTGISSPFNPPSDPFVTVHTNEQTTEESADIILKKLNI